MNVIGNTELRRRYGSDSSSSNNANNSYVIQSNGFTKESNSSGFTLKNEMTSSRDRTAEFMSTVRSLQGRNQTTGFSQTKNLMKETSEFMKIAQSIGKDIANTYAKLEKLTLLAKRRTLFDDRPAEIQELTYIIKEDMNTLNRQISQLQQIARTQSSSGGGRLQKSQHSSSVVVSLQSKLASMTTSFKRVLEVRTENLKESKSRQGLFCEGNVTNTLPQSAINGFHSGSVLAAAAAADDDEQQHKSDVSIPMIGVQSQVHMENEHSYLQSRADTMQNIESTIVELGGIFSQLAHMIKEQEEVMLRIDSNVEATAINVELGHREILKYFQSVTSNRWLMAKIFGVLIFFFIFFVVFLA